MNFPFTFSARVARHVSRPLAVVLLALAPIIPARALELRFLNAEGAEPALKFENHGEVVAITANENTLSPVYAFTPAGTAPLVLFKETVIAGKRARVTAATLPVPAGLTHALVILSAADKTLATYSATWIDDSPATRPAGTVLLLNRSRYPLAFKLDAEEFTLAPQGVHQMPFSQDINRIVVQADAQVGDKWERVFGNPLRVRGGVRVLLLLRDGRPQIGAKTNLVDMLSFYDRPTETRPETLPPAQPPVATPDAALPGPR